MQYVLEKFAKLCKYDLKRKYFLTFSERPVFEELVHFSHNL